MQVTKEKLLCAVAFCIIAIAAWFLLSWLWKLVTAFFGVVLLSSVAIWIIIIAITIVLLHFKLLGVLFSWVWSKSR